MTNEVASQRLVIPYNNQRVFFKIIRVSIIFLHKSAYEAMIAMAELIELCLWPERMHGF